jgi:hypothetical protein
MLASAVCEVGCHENDLRGDSSCFRVHDRHGRIHDHCADRVMTDLLMFLGRGFALLAGAPALVYPDPRLSRRAVKSERMKGPAGW